MFIHPPHCCVGAAVASKARLLVAALLVLGSPCCPAWAVHPTQAGTPALCHHLVWGLPLGGMASPPCPSENVPVPPPEPAGGLHWIQPLRLHGSQCATGWSAETSHCC